MVSPVGGVLVSTILIKFVVELAIGGGVGGGEPGEGLGVLTSVILKLECALLLQFLLESKAPTSWTGPAFHNEDRILVIFYKTVLKK